MIQFIVDNKDVLSLCACVLGILLALVFGGIRSWRHHICHEYRWDRDVTVNILESDFIRRTCDHYSGVARERKRRKTAVAEIFKRPEQQQVFQELGEVVADKARVQGLFRWLVWASEASFGCLWVAIIVVVIGIAIVCISPPIYVWVIWAILLAVLLIGFAVSVTVMWILDGRFFRLVHRFIAPEGE